MLLTQLFIFFISLVVLIKSSDYFTDSAEKVGLYFKFPAFIVGVTIISVGTSLPELVTSIMSVLKHHSEIVAGNVTGSDIANILLILGISSIIAKDMRFEHDIMRVDLPILAASSFFLFFCVQDGIFSTIEGVLSILLLVVYLLYASQAKKSTFENVLIEKLGFKTPIILILSIIFVNISAEYTVSSIVKISAILHIPTEVIAASALAIGTSLPELVVSITAIKKGNIEMSVGNVVGSNIFNTFGVMGTASLFGNIKIGSDVINFYIPFVVASTILLVFAIQNKVMSRWIGYTFVIFYIFYILKLFL